LRNWEKPRKESGQPVTCVSALSYLVGWLAASFTFNIANHSVRDTENFNEETKLNVLFYLVPPDFRQSTASWKVPRLRPFVLLFIATFRWGWIWRIGGMLLTGLNYFKKRLFQCHFVYHKSYTVWLDIEPEPPRWETSD